MLRDNLVELIEPMLISAGADPLPLCIHNQPQASDDRLPCLENPRPAGAEPSLTENVTSPFQAEPAQAVDGKCGEPSKLKNSSANKRSHKGRPSRVWTLPCLPSIYGVWIPCDASL